MNEQDDVTQESLSDGPDTGTVLEELNEVVENHGDPHPIQGHDDAEEIPVEVVAETLDVVAVDVHDAEVVE